MTITKKLFLSIFASLAFIWIAGGFLTEHAANRTRHEAKQKTTAEANFLLQQIGDVIRDRIAMWGAVVESAGVIDGLAIARVHESTTGAASADGFPVTEALDDFIARLETKSERRIFGDAAALVTDHAGSLSWISRHDAPHDDDPTSQVWWRECMANGTYVRHSSGTGDLEDCIDLFVRLDDSAGEARGVLRAAMQAEEITRVVDSWIAAHPTEEEGRIRLFDRDESLIYQVVWSPEGIRSSAIGGDPSSGLTTLESSRPSISAGASLPDIGMSLRVDHDETAVLAAITRMGMQIRVVTLVAGLLAALSGGVVVLSISRRITSLAQAADLIRHGDLEQRVVVEGTDEIAILGRRIDSMREDLLDALVEVERRADDAIEKNRDLTSQIEERARAERDRDRLEVQLRGAQKLEAVGQLASGIAHEINTPTQFVGDNLTFLQDSFLDLFEYIDNSEKVVGRSERELVTALSRIAEEADLTYLREEVPQALEQAKDGIERVARIVRSMKEFAHPGPAQRVAIELNRAIESTTTVARNEYKYVADLVLDLDPDLPRVPCFPNEFNQVVLNLVINAAHAIEATRPEDDDAAAAGGKLGELRITTRRVDDWVEVSVSDTGTGIPEDIRSRVFDPFFTTKEVGKGSGQGLALAHDFIVRKMGGQLKLQSEVGVGTTFVVRLPLDEALLSSTQVAHARGTVS